MTPPRSLHASLDEVALVVAALDRHDAESLLKQFPPPVADRVRRRVGDLTEIDPAAQQQAVARLLGQTHRREPDAASVSERSASWKHPPFQFLRDATPDAVSRLLCDEHPQVVAVVIAHLPPDVAAEVIRIMPAKRQADVLARVAHLDEMAPAALASLEEAIESLLACYGNRHPGRTTGVQAVRAIMANVDRTQRADLLASLDTRDQALRRALGAPDGPAAVSTADPESDSHRSTTAETSPGVPLSRTTPPRRFDFNDLERLAPRDWPALLQNAGSELMLVAMAGAPPDVVRQFLALVPRKTARSLQRRMEQIGPIQLQDIEQAQRRVARIAAELIATGQIAAPSCRHFAAAV